MYVRELQAFLLSKDFVVRLKPEKQSEFNVNQINVFDTNKNSFEKKNMPKILRKIIYLRIEFLQ